MKAAEGSAEPLGQLRSVLLGEAPRFLKAIEHLSVLAERDDTFVIAGEPGTGKELAARSVHGLGKRAPYPFVSVNCGLFPHSLFENELFGRERGAYDAAGTRGRGVIAMADRGTLFLDQLDALHPDAQADLVSLLADRTYRPAGSGPGRLPDVRVVAATSRPLDRLVNDGTFRADLYQRLTRFNIDLPPLRERGNDIALLAFHFLEKHAPPDRANLRLSEAAMRALAAYNWPENVEELENAVVRGIRISDGVTVEVDDLLIPALLGSG